MSRRPKRRGGGRDFVQLFRFVKRSQAWHGLGLPARCALIELLHRFTGINNGMIRLGVRELAGELRCSHGTAVNAFRELDDSGLAHPQTGGRWRGKIATEWRITFYRCDVSGELPILSWPARDAVSHESAKGQPRKRKPLLPSATKAQTPKSSINWSAVRSTSKALLESNQGDTVSDTRTEGAATPILDPLSEGQSESKNNFGVFDERISALQNWGVNAEKGSPQA